MSNLELSSTKAGWLHSVFSPFDRLVGVVALVLVGAIGLTLLLGDRVGVQLVRVAPLGAARSTSRIVIEFSEAMQRDSVTQRFRVEPPLQGEFSWNGTTLTFRPSEVMPPESDYTVVLEKGAQSEIGREVLSEYRFSFSVGTPRVAFVAPADRPPQNIWIADPRDPASAKQVTFSPSGVFDFGVSPDGTQIAFSERNSNTGTSDIKLLDLESEALIQLTNCTDSDCTTPTWRPDGRMIAYTRVDFNSGLDQVGVSPSRVWLLDLSTTPPSTRPLFSESQILGYGPQWSADGSRISIFDSASLGILVYDFDDGSVDLINSRNGTAGSLSPDGTQLVYAEVVLDGSGARSYIRLADLEGEELVNLTDPQEAVDDDAAIWSPDGSFLVIARRYTDERYTRGRQLYRMNLDDNTVEPLVVDPLYAHGFFSFDPTGTQLVMQRFQEVLEDGQPNSEGRPEIWTYNLETGEFTLVAENAYQPRWVP